MRRALCLLPVLLLCACASQPPSPTYYLLRPAADLDSAQLQPSTRYTLGEVSIAPYINQPGLLLETGEGRVRPAALHLWAEPIEAGIRTYLLQEISRLYGRDLLPGGTGDQRINLRIDQLHGTLEGDARLVAYWWLDGDDGAMGARRFARSQPLAANGYNALASAERDLLGQLAADIAAALQAPVDEENAAQ